MLKTSEATASLICALYHNRIPVNKLAEMAGVSLTTVYVVLREQKAKLAGHGRIVRDRGPEFTPEQWEIINGSLLGDGHISKTKKGNSWFVKPQTARRIEYLQWHFDKLVPYSSIVSRRTVHKPVHFNGVFSVHPTETLDVAVFNSKSSTRFSELRKLWYPEGKKIVPVDLKLTPLTTAIWFCDDGCNQPKDRRALFCTEGFTVQDCEILISKLRDAVAVKCHIKKSPRRNSKPSVLISQTDYLTFLDYIRPHIPCRCFDYKASLNGYTPPGPRYNAKLTEDDVLHIRELASCGMGYKEIAVKYNVSEGSVFNIVRGLSWKKLIPEGVSLAAPPRKRYDFDGLSLTVSEWARRLGIKKNTLIYRLRLGWTLEEAFAI